MAAGKNLHSGEKDGEGQPGLTLDVIALTVYYLKNAKKEMIVWAMK